jgi:hypothetical protein
MGSPEAAAEGEHSQDAGEQAAHLHHEHHRIPDHVSWIQFSERVQNRAPNDRP